MSEFHRGDLVIVIGKRTFEELVPPGWPLIDSVHMVVGIETVHNGDGSTSHYYDLLSLHPKCSWSSTPAASYNVSYSMWAEDLDEYKGEVSELPESAIMVIRAYINEKKNYYETELALIGAMERKVFSKLDKPAMSHDRQLTIGEL